MKRKVNAEILGGIHMEGDGPKLPTDIALRRLVRNVVREALDRRDEWKNVVVSVRDPAAQTILRR